MMLVMYVPIPFHTMCLANRRGQYIKATFPLVRLIYRVESIG